MDATSSGNVRITLRARCPGHFGHMTLVTPLYHPNYIEDVVRILKCVCFNCSRVLLDYHDKRYKRICKMYPNQRLTELLRCVKKSKCSFVHNGVDEGCLSDNPTFKKAEHNMIVKGYRQSGENREFDVSPATA